MFATDPAKSAAFLTDEEGNIITWNDGCESLFGIPSHAIVGQPLSALLLDDDCPLEWPDRWAELAQQAQYEALAVELRSGASKTFSAALTLAPQYDKRAEFRGCVAAVTTGPDAATSESARIGRVPLAALVDTFPGTFYVVNQHGRLVLWNHNLERVSEMTPDELAAVNVLDMFDLGERPLIADSMRKVFDEGEEVRVEAEYISKSGREMPYLLCGTRIAFDGVPYLFGMGVDITERRARERLLRLRERALHAASNGIVVTGSDGVDHPIEYVNPAFERITGYSADEVIGRDSRFMAAPGIDTVERAQVRQALAAHRAVNVVFRNLRKNGELFWNDLHITPVNDDRGKVSHFIGVISDVTATKQRTAHLEHEVNHDALTGLANRNLLWDRLTQALHLATRNKSLVATVLIDLNNFKTINDTFGHEAGDVVLKVVARRLEASVRDSDTVARMSGDEFVLVLVNQPSVRFTLRMIERLRQGLTMPVAFNNKEIPVGASIGVALFPHDGNSVTELVRAADVAMYHAKASGDDAVHFFSADMKASTEAKQRLETALREALARDELFLLYQPRIDMRSGKVSAFEALLRWRQPDGRVLLPADFLAEAEETGLIVRIGNRVLDHACAFAKRLQQLGFEGVPVAVNASHREYSQHDFVSGIAERLRALDLPPGSIEVELREDGLIRNPALGLDVSAQMRLLGMPLAVDAFGDGISDLVYLQQLCAGRLKLARAAVHAISGNGPGSTIAKTLIDIGHNLSIEVVAEAVETRDQADFLRMHGCDQIQGNWFSAPLGGEAAQRMLSAQQRV
jgi:diguanylate cyclase (GGDEF)-like protein/PAS domain S-box-containing protein